MDLREIEQESVRWINLARDGDQWWTILNTVTDRRVP